MKKLLIFISVLALSACSSGGGGGGAAAPKGGIVTEFGKKIEGEWTSECIDGDQGPFKDSLSINANGTG